ncbi:MAG: autotransporter adhesin family protein, partial [Rhodospirillales bacterium]|nr:autotransporter adhesin family protein [Rhodospirillales bacterium]
MAVWTGNGDGVSWSDPNNWSPVGVPAPYQSVTIAQVGSDPVSVLVAAGQTEAGNPLILGAAGTSEAVTLTNDGTFSNYAGVTIYAGTTLDNAGKMTLNGFTDDGTMINSGQLTVNGNVAVSASGLFDTLAGGVSSVSGTIAVAGTLEVGGTLKVATALTGAGSVLVDGGTLTSGSGGPAAIGNSSLAFTISNGGTLSVTPPPGTVSFAFGPSAPGQVNTLIVPSYSGTITGQITNFGPGDMISTGGRSSTGSATFNGTDYTVVIGSVTLDHVALAPGLTGSSLTFGSGTVGAAACYLKGTRILTDLGPIPIERLREGDLVLTASGSKRPIRWIGRRHYPAQVAAANPDIRPVLIRAGALGVGALGEGVPRRDLFVSPRHAMFLDGMLIAAMHLANGVSVLHGDWVGDVTYLHLELDSHDILFAEGAASESFVDEDSRHIFDNAASFQANPMAAPARACAARIED